MNLSELITFYTLTNQIILHRLDHFNDNKCYLTIEDFSAIYCRPVDISYRPEDFTFISGTIESWVPSISTSCRSIPIKDYAHLLTLLGECQP